MLLVSAGASPRGASGAGDEFARGAAEPRTEEET
jgi:hypothetical protein